MDGLLEDGMDPDVGLVEAGGVGCLGPAGHHIPAVPACRLTTHH